MDIKTITNPIFKKNIVDNENGVIVKSIYLKKKTRMDRDMKTLVWQYYRHRKSLNVNDVIKKYGRDSLIINYSVKPKNDSHIDDNDSSVNNVCMTDCCMTDACMTDACINGCDYSTIDYSMNGCIDCSMNGIGMNGIAKGTFAEGTFGGGGGGGGGGGSTIDYIDHGIMDELQTEIETIINNNYDPYTLSGPLFHCTMYDLIDHTRMI